MTEDISTRTDREKVYVFVNDTGGKQADRASIIRAMGHGVKSNFLDMTALIRSIQRTEGNDDCYGRGQSDCDQVDCAWRLYCLESNETSK